ncbi:transcription factor SOX-21 [Nothoprocta perdicaria]|uniref:transcription factor SOX-21 n=1 Tax=Nothoprocta perdicaria TaxID=30464 RepID=UPI000E1BD002|nr:transcription factor SOX-21 [Nothoprocta perdicaria]
MRSGRARCHRERGTGWSRRPRRGQQVVAGSRLGGPARREVGEKRWGDETCSTGFHSPYSLLDLGSKMAEISSSASSGAALPYASSLGYAGAGSFHGAAAAAAAAAASGGGHTHSHPSPGNPGYMIPCNCSAWPGAGLQPPLAYILLPGMGKPQLDPYPAAYAAAL